MRSRDKGILALGIALAASAVRRLHDGPSNAETFTGGGIYWLGYAIGMLLLPAVAAGIWLMLKRNRQDRVSYAADTLLWGTVLIALLLTAKTLL